MNLFAKFDKILSLNTFKSVENINIYLETILKTLQNILLFHHHTQIFSLGIRFTIGKVFTNNRVRETIFFISIFYFFDLIDVSTKTLKIEFKF